MTKGTLYVISAASGAGKTSLVNAIVRLLPALEVSVSHTTRAKRVGEEEGVNYHFVNQKSFNAMVSNDDFFEHARVFGNMYGTSRQHIQQQLLRGRDVILEIDWQGAQQIRQRMPDCKTIHVLPPSIEALRARLKSRGQDNDTVIEQRMREAVKEMSHYAEYDYLVINDEFDVARDNLAAIIVGNGMRLEVQQKKHADLLTELLTFDKFGE